MNACASYYKKCMNLGQRKIKISNNVECKQQCCRKMDTPENKKQGNEGFGIVAQCSDSPFLAILENQVQVNYFSATSPEPSMRGIGKT